MDFRSFGPRLLVRLVLLLGLLAVSNPPAGAQEVSTVTIYKTECPAGFDGEDQGDLYDTCYDNPVTGQSFSAQQGKSDEAPAVDTTGAGGSATLPLYGGATIISEGLPQGISEYFVFCSQEDSSAVEFEYTGDTFGIFLEEEGGDYFSTGSHLHCDWYNIPATEDDDGGEGTLTLYRVACPAGYQGDDYYDDCYDNPIAGADFGIRRQGSHSIAGFSTGPDGAAFASLSLAGEGISAPTTMVVIESTGSFDDGQPIDYLDYVVNCTKNGGEPVAIDYGQPGVMDIIFDAAPDDTILCDWFYIAPAAGDDSASVDDNVSMEDNAAGVSVLPDTGTGTTSGTNEGALALLAIAGSGVAAVVGVRRRLARQ
jgi:hypothetical protein